MPLALDPSATIWAHLESDKDKNPRPEFEIRFLTRRELSRANKIIDESRAGVDYDASHAKLDEALAIGVVGWREIKSRDGTAITFGVGKLDEVLTGREKFELAELMLSLPRASEAEKKSSGLPAISPPESSADAAKSE